MYQQNGYVCVGTPIPNNGCKCDVTIINNIDINIKNLIIVCNKLMTKMEAMEQVLTREDVDYIQEQTLRANLAVANHDIKIVKMLESMGGNVETINDSMEVATLNESTDIVPVSNDVFEVKKGLFGKEKVVKVK